MSLTSILVVAAEIAENGGGGVHLSVVWLGLGGLATLITAIIGGVIALRKYGPEVNKVQIDSANALVEMAKTTAAMSSEQAEDLRKRNQALDDRITELAGKMGEYEARIEELEKVASLVEELKRERQRLMADNRRLSKRVTDLEKELALLRQEHDLTTTDPDHSA